MSPWSCPAFLLSAAALLTAAPASSQTSAGQPASVATSSPTPGARVTMAKELFRKGVALLNAGDFDGALDFFSRSRAFVPSNHNTRNAAICLERLARYDEALEMYEELLRSFGAQLTPAEQAVLRQVLHDLAQKVGSLQITANTDGQVLVDGRDRGQLPRIWPIRVMGFRHRIRIAKDGYAPFETVVDVALGSLLTVSAELRLLPGMGVLRVEDLGERGERISLSSNPLEATEVFIDDQRVGAAPWEGVVKPGRHLVWTRRGSRGSAPVAVVVVQGQTALARMASSALGPKLRIEASPPTAEISLDGIPLGNRSWAGRLPVGMHQVSVAEAGYLAESKMLMVPPSGAEEEPANTELRSAGAMPLGPERGAARGTASPEPSSSLDLRFALLLDPGHARWNRRAESPVSPRGRAFGGAFSGYLGSLTLHPGDGLGCTGSCRGDPPARGFLVGLRSGYRIGLGFAPELVGGYMAFSSERTALRGPFFGAGMSYRIGLPSFLGLMLRTTVGLFSATTETGTIQVSTQPFFVMPEVGVDAAFGGLHLGIQFGLGFFPSGGQVVNRENEAHGQVQVYGPFALLSTQLAAAYFFD